MAEAHAAATEPAPRRRSGVMSRVKATAFVSVIVILEVAAATVCLPTADQSRTMGEELVASHSGDKVD
jgi:hypothetical protein